MTIWSTFLHSCKIIFHCDNQSVVHILNSGTSRCHHIMSLIHCLFYVCCKFNIVIAAVHIPRLKNSPAVALSQLQVGQFQELVLYVAALFTPVPFLDLASFKYCLKDHSLFPSGSHIHYSPHLQLRTTPIFDVLWHSQPHRTSRQRKYYTYLYHWFSKNTSRGTPN